MKFTLAIFITLFFQSTTYANISVSEYRLFVDRKHNSEEVLVSNNGPLSQNCELGFSHYKFDENGGFRDYPDKTMIPENSASRLIRFSPKHFRLTPSSKQKVRLKLRNKRDIKVQEYRAHLTVSCKADTKNDTQENNGAFKITPQLIPNIPIVARPRKLHAQISIDNIKTMPNNTLTFDLNRTGKRSIYGKVNIWDEDKNLVTESRLFPIYHETTSKHLSINLPEFSGQTLKIEFAEDENKSGTMVTSSIYKIK
jgi:hypothetical protein